MRVGQRGESFENKGRVFLAGGLPLDGAGEQSTAEVQDALKLFHFSPGERKVLAVQQNG